MIPAIVLAFLGALYARHLALISDLPLAGIVLALLTALIATEPEECRPPPPGAGPFPVRHGHEISRRHREYSL